MAATWKEIFGIDELNEFQRRTFDALLSNSDVFLCVKTGGGKSLCYQAFPMLYAEKFDQTCRVLVLSPLLSIMKEQVAFLNSKGITATYIGSDSDYEQIMNGSFTIIFTSPEMIIANEKWRDALKETKDIKLLVVDEAHTVIRWYVIWKLWIHECNHECNHVPFE